MSSKINLKDFEYMQDEISEFDTPRTPTVKKMKFEDAQVRHIKKEKPRQERHRWEEVE